MKLSSAMKFSSAIKLSSAMKLSSTMQHFLLNKANSPGSIFKPNNLLYLKLTLPVTVGSKSVAPS
jgi:hypothetical protein